MTLKILCFEDEIEDQKMLSEVFKNHNVEFKFFNDWTIEPERVSEISEFRPDFAIVDLLDNATQQDLGSRLIRKLKNTPQTESLPVVAWSVLLRDDVEGLRTQERVERYGGKPLQKSSQIIPSAERFLEAAGLMPPPA